MKHFLMVFLLPFSSDEPFALNPNRYKVHVVTWDKNRVTGHVEAINDITLSVKTKDGTLFNFSDKQTKPLKIWKPGINFSATAIGGVALTATFVIAAPKRRFSWQSNIGFLWSNLKHNCWVSGR